MVDALRLLDRPHRELVTALATGAPVFVPVNPVEYHGPHLPLHTDALVSQGLIRDLHQRLAERHPEWPLLVTADLELGVDPTPGPGSQPVPYPIVRQRVLEACRALAEAGAKRVVLMTFHGGPLHNMALEAGVQWLRRHGVPALAPLNLVMRQMLELDDPSRYAPAYQHIEDRAIREELLSNLALDFHGGFFETSMLLHYAPGSVGELSSVVPCAPVVPLPLISRLARAVRALGLVGLSKELQLAAAGLGWFALRPFPGYTSRPSYARAESGRVFAEAIVEDFAASAEAVFAGAAPPAPIMSWIPWFSFGGRVGSPHIPLQAMGAGAPIKT